jgi:hypothetical protein
LDSTWILLVLKKSPFYLTATSLLKRNGIKEGKDYIPREGNATTENKDWLDVSALS